MFISTGVLVFLFIVWVLAQSDSDSENKHAAQKLILESMILEFNELENSARGLGALVFMKRTNDTGDPRWTNFITALRTGELQQAIETYRLTPVSSRFYLDETDVRNTKT